MLPHLSRLPHLPGVSHLHVNRPLRITRSVKTPWHKGLVSVVARSSRLWAPSCLRLILILGIFIIQRLLLIIINYSQSEKLIYFTIQGKFATNSPISFKMFWPRHNLLVCQVFYPKWCRGTLLRSILLERDGPDYKQGTGTEGHFSNLHLGPSTQTVIGHLHDDVIILLRAETFRVLLFSANQGLCYLSLTGISKLKYERKNERESGRTWK